MKLTSENKKEIEAAIAKGGYYLIAFRPQGSNGPIHFDNGTNMGAELPENAIQYDYSDAEEAIKGWQSEAWLTDENGEQV